MERKRNNFSSTTVSKERLYLAPSLEVCRIKPCLPQCDPALGRKPRAQITPWCPGGDSLLPRWDNFAGCLWAPRTPLPPFPHPSGSFQPSRAWGRQFPLFRRGVSGWGQRGLARGPCPAPPRDPRPGAGTAPPAAAPGGRKEGRKEGGKRGGRESGKEGGREGG